MKLMFTSKPRLYEFTYDKVINEEGISLFNRENDVITALTDNEIFDDPVVLMTTFFMEDHKAVQLTPKVKELLLSNFENVQQVLGLTLFTACDVKEVETWKTSTDYSECYDCEVMSERKWIRYFKKTCKAFCNPRVKSIYNVLFDHIDHAMAKGRKSLREEERGDSYLSN